MSNLHARTNLALLRVAGLITWLCVGLALALSERVREHLEASSDDWHSPLLLFGAWITFALCQWAVSQGFGSVRGGARSLALLLGMTLSALIVSWTSNTGLAGILLMVVAGTLPWVVNVRVGLVWLVTQNLALVWMMSALGAFRPLEAMLQSALFLGLCFFVFLTSLVARRQAESREELRKVNSELRATQALLSESTRMAERVRISRELHDLIGHHLTALSINLEVASHLVSGQAETHVRQAQSVARLLLSDVREVVSQLRHGDSIDLNEALMSLAEGIPQPKIHMQLEAPMSIDDPKLAQVLLRCTQEVITNTIKHAQARNLWLNFRIEDGGIGMEARDDGRGAAQLGEGNGLIGMGERLRQVGGWLRVKSEPGQGFQISAWMPREKYA